MKMLIHIRIVLQDDQIGQKLSDVPQSVGDTDRKIEKKEMMGLKEYYRTSLAPDSKEGIAQQYQQMNVQIQSTKNVLRYFYIQRTDIYYPIKNKI